MGIINCFLISFEPNAEEGSHAWYCKPSKIPVTEEEVISPSRELTLLD